MQGIQGQHGIGISNITLDQEGYLLIRTTDGKDYKVGPIIGPQGPQGLQGPKGDSGTSGSDGTSVSEATIISKIIEFIKKIIAGLFGAA